jgi:hypothetical protein
MYGRSEPAARSARAGARDGSRSRAALTIGRIGLIGSKQEPVRQDRRPLEYR